MIFELPYSRNSAAACEGSTCRTTNYLLKHDGRGDLSLNNNIRYRRTVVSGRQKSLIY